MKLWKKESDEDGKKVKRKAFPDSSVCFVWYKNKVIIIRNQTWSGSHDEKASRKTMCKIKITETLWYDIVVIKATNINTCYVDECEADNNDMELKKKKENIKLWSHISC